MKDKYHNILVIFLAAIVFFVGAGVTVVDLCCARCVHSIFSSDANMQDCSFQEDGEKMASCCASTENLDVNLDDTSSCASSDQDDECCTTSRVFIDLDNSIYQPKLFSSLLWISTFCCCHLYAYYCTHETQFSDEVSKIQILSPRTYLSLIRVLII